MMGSGVTFTDKIHTERDWGLKLLSLYIPMPTPKQQLIDIRAVMGVSTLQRSTGIRHITTGTVWS